MYKYIQWIILTTDLIDSVSDKVVRTIFICSYFQFIFIKHLVLGPRQQIFAYIE